MEKNIEKFVKEKFTFLIENHKFTYNYIYESPAEYFIFTRDEILIEIKVYQQFQDIYLHISDGGIKNQIDITKTLSHLYAEWRKEHSFKTRFRLSFIEIYMELLSEIFKNEIKNTNKIFGYHIINQD